MFSHLLHATITRTNGTDALSATDAEHLRYLKCTRHGLPWRADRLSQRRPSKRHTFRQRVAVLESEGYQSRDSAVPNGAQSFCLFRLVRERSVHRMNVLRSRNTPNER